MSDDAICPCQGDDPDPGPHIASCPWSDPDYDGGFAEDAVVESLRALFAAHFRDRRACGHCNGSGEALDCSRCDGDDHDCRVVLCARCGTGSDPLRVVEL